MPPRRRVPAASFGPQGEGPAWSRGGGQRPRARGGRPGPPSSQGRPRWCRGEAGGQPGPAEGEWPRAPCWEVRGGVARSSGGGRGSAGFRQGEVGPRRPVPGEAGAARAGARVGGVVGRRCRWLAHSSWKSPRILPSLPNPASPSPLPQSQQYPPLLPISMATVQELGLVWGGGGWGGTRPDILVSGAGVGAGGGGGEKMSQAGTPLGTHFPKADSLEKSRDWEMTAPQSPDPHPTQGSQPQSPSAWGHQCQALLVRPPCTSSSQTCPQVTPPHTHRHRPSRCCPLDSPPRAASPAPHTTS